MGMSTHKEKKCFKHLNKIEAERKSNKEKVQESQKNLIERLEKRARELTQERQERMHRGYIIPEAQMEPPIMGKPHFGEEARTSDRDIVEEEELVEMPEEIKGSGNPCLSSYSYYADFSKIEKKKKQKESSSNDPVIRMVGSETYSLEISTEQYLSVKKWNEFSCGVRLFGGIEEIYQNYGIDSAKKLIDFVINNFNSLCRESGINGGIFGLFSITDRYEELINYFYKIAHTASDFENNPNSDSRIIIFTLKLK